MISRLEEDYNTCGRNFKRRGFWVLTIYRMGNQMLKNKRSYSLLFPLYRVCKFLAEVATGIEISPESEIGQRLNIIHYGGIQIHPGTTIGDGVTLRNSVVIGQKGPKGQKGPTIGPGVDIGSGVKILGSVNIGASAVIGANSIVVDDVPEGATVIGSPAKVIYQRKKEDYSEL